MIMDKKGVPYLINALCQNLLKPTIKSNSLSEKDTNNIVSHLKKKSFHILLNEKWKSEKLKFVREFHNDIETELIIFQISLLTNNKVLKAEKFKKCIAKIDIKNNENILKLLLLLTNKNICGNEEDENEMPNFYERDSYEYVIDNLPFLKGHINQLQLMKFDDSPYIDKKLLDIQPLAESLLIENGFTCNYFQNLNTIKPEIDNLPRKLKHENIWDMLLNENLQEKICQDLRHVNNFINNSNTLFESDVDIIYVVWEIILRNRMNLVSRNIETESPNVIHSSQFLIDAQNVLVGIESNSFIWSEDDRKFLVKNGLCVKGTLPHTFNLLCEDLLLGGTLFSRLYALLKLSKQNGHTLNDLCLKLPAFLNFYRSNVLLFKGNTISDFKVYTKKLVEIIHSVSRCFFINIDATDNEVWKGIDLLNNIYQEFSRTTKNDYLFIIHYFLFHCYQNYFRRFIKPWIMDGVLIDPYNEFFVKKNTNFTQYRNRKYWTQGFKISTEITVPFFLKEYLNLILLCGKSVCLVKHCFQNSETTSFLESDSFEMNLCASENQLINLKSMCEQNTMFEILNRNQLISFQDMFDIKKKNAIDLKFQAAETQASTLLNIQKQMKEKNELRIQKKQKIIQKHERERKTSQLIKDLITCQELRKELVEYNEQKHLEQEKTRLLNLEKEELRNKYANLTKNLELQHSLLDNRTALLEAYLNKTTLSLPLTTQPIDDTIRYENITNINNLNQNMLNGLTESKSSFICDNLTTPTNNNLVWNANIIEITRNDNHNDFEDSLKSILVRKSEVINTNEKMNILQNENVNLLVNNSKTLATEIVEKCTEIEGNNSKSEELNPYIENKYNFDNIEKLEFIWDTRWEALNPKENNVDDKNIEIDLEYFERQRYPINPFDVLKVLYTYPKVVPNKQGPKKKSIIPNLNCNELKFEDLSLSNCKLFDLHAEQSLLLPLDSQLSVLNNRLMRHFLNDFQILNHFQTLSNFYFFFNPEYEQNFTKQLFELLYNANYPKEVFNSKILYEIITFSVTTNNLHNMDGFKDKISLQLVSMPSVLNLQSVDLLNCLTLTYQVEWPLNIIFTDKVLQKYNKIFQYLLRLRRVQWVLNDIFNRLKFFQKEMNFDDIILMRSQHFKGIHLMRHVMNTWLTLMLCHVTEVVLHSSWYEFEKDLTKAKTIDDIYRTHKQFIKDAVFRCSLNDNSDFYMQKVNQAFELIFQFHELFCNRQFHLKENNYLHPNYYKLQLCFSNVKEMMRYIIKICEKQVRKEYQPHLDQIINIVNFNNYFDLDN